MSYGAGLAIGMDAPPVESGKASSTVYVMGLAAMGLVALAIFAGAKDGKRAMATPRRAKYDYRHKKTGWGDLDANVRQAEYGL